VAALAALGVAFEGTPPLLPAKGCPVSARHAWEAPRSAGFLARERSEPREHFWRILFERSERSERSELCAGPGTRAPQGSLSAAKAASVACRALTGQPFAATISRVQTNDRTGPQAAAPRPLAEGRASARAFDCRQEGPPVQRVGGLRWGVRRRCG